MSERMAFACASAATLLGALGLSGWVTPWPRLARLSPASIPMVPSAALVLLLFGGTLMCEARRRSPRLAVVVAVVVSIFGCAQLLTSLGALTPTLDAFFVPAPDLFPGVPTGRAPALTALGFLAAGLSLLFLGTLNGSRTLSTAGASLAFGVHLLGMVATLGYLFGAPLLYGGTVLPIPFSTGLALGGLGLALVGIAPRDVAPLRPFTDSSARATLLRAFLPIVPAIVIGHLLFAQIPGVNPALHTALTALLSAFVVAAVVSYAAHGVGRELERAQADRIVRHERDFSEAVLNSLPGVLYLYDENGKFLRWNENFARRTGYTAAEIATMHPLDFIGGADKEQVAARISEVFDKGESSVEASLLSKDGRETPYYFTGIATQVGGKRCLIGVGIDISERTRAEDARRTSDARYRTLFEQAPDGIVIADPRSYYLDANASMCQMLGYSRDELIGKHASDIVVPAEIPHIEPALNAIKGRSEYHREWHFRRRDGSVFPAEVIATLMPDGNLLGMIRDITERKAAETALRELNETLELKVAARTGELQTALVRAEAADRLKSAFLATMSHELRTPLNSIIGFTGVVLQGLAGPLNPEQTKQLGMVRGSARHLLELINDVLDLSKIEAGQLEVRTEPFDLCTSIERVTGSVRPLAEKKGLVLSAAVPPVCGEMTSDRRRVEQIVLNLLNNAIKFTDQGCVTLTAERVDDFRPATGAPPQPAVRLRVADTGMGIRPEDLATLFQPFRQLDTGLTRRHDGTGLGLAICRRLTDLLGGEIHAASEWSQGSEFTVTLPLRRRSVP